MIWLIGLIIGVGSALLGFAMQGGNVLALWHPFEILSIVGLGVGYLVAGNTMRTVKISLKMLPKALTAAKTSKNKCMDVLCLVFEILQKIRRDGLMTIEVDIEEPENSQIFQKYPNIMKDHHLMDFICDYFRMMLGGSLNVQQIEALMEQEIDVHHQENQLPVTVFTRLGDAFPAFGIIVAVMGVVNVMGSIGLPPAELGKLIGAALVGTFLGILLSYAVVSPIAYAMQQNLEVDSKPYLAVKATLLASLNGFPPQAAVEFGRKVLFSDMRPSFRELDEQTKMTKSK